jgi:hypothetical protein
MGIIHGAESANTTGLVLWLDAANIKSYPGTGTVWFDLGPLARHYSINGATWNSAGYFNCVASTGVTRFTGPASNSFNFSTSNEHTIEVVAKVNSTATTSTFFSWTGAVSGDPRAIQGHLTWSDGVMYYDVGGCCSATQRISYAPANLTTTTEHFVWRTRPSTNPQREFFRNAVSQVNSGSNGTSTSTWAVTDAAYIANNWSGDLYLFKAYNRALTDAEITANYLLAKKRFPV